MAAWAKSEKILSLIRLFRRRKLTERANVMYRKAVSYELAAVGTFPSLLCNNSLANAEPVLAPICTGTALPEGRLFARFVNVSVFIAAGPRAKIARTSVSETPRLAVELSLAVFANAPDGWNIVRILLPGIMRRLGIVFGRRPLRIHGLNFRHTLALARTEPRAI